VFSNSITFSGHDFESLVSKFENQPISLRLINELKSDIIKYGKSRGLLLIEPSQPAVNLEAGELRLAIIVGKYSRIHIKGNKWFNDSLIEKKIGIKSGDDIKTFDIENALNWSNQNPFRQVQINLDTYNKPFGEADIDIDIQEIRPFRATISFSNAINSPLGNTSYSSSAQYGNLWGLDHEFSFQYSTNNTPRYDQSYNFSYKAPLFWHDYFRTDFAYSLVYPQSLLGYVGLNEKAKNTVLDLRYIKPIKRGLITYEYSLGIDYKQISTNLLFGSITNPIAVYDVGQLLTGLTMIIKDTNGSWIFGSSANFSPGGMNTRNTDKSYNVSGSSGRRSRYIYGKIILERSTNIPFGIQWISRGQIQISSSNLEGSEQLLLGGGATVRGYSQSYSGDQGWIINQELRTKYFKSHIPFTLKSKTQLTTQFVSFLDYGYVNYKHVTAADITLPRLMGTGVGIRATIYNNFSMGSDMSWPIVTPTYIDNHPAKGTFWASLSY